jgi:hypothetical protein
MRRRDAQQDVLEERAAGSERDALPTSSWSKAARDGDRAPVRFRTGAGRLDERHEPACTEVRLSSRPEAKKAPSAPKTRGALGIGYDDVEPAHRCGVEARRVSKHAEEVRRLRLAEAPDWIHVLLFVEGQAVIG